MLKEYPKFKRGEAEKIYDKLPEGEQKIIKKYMLYRAGNDLSDTSDLRRYIIQIRHIIRCNFKKFKKLDQHADLSILIKNSHLSLEVKKNLKINLNNFFGEYLMPKEWTKQFRRVYSNKNAHKGDDTENENIKDLPTDKEVEDMLKTENRTYWKSFLLVQDFTGLRTKECRTIEIPKITFNSDNTATIEIYMTKTGKDKVVFTDKQTTDFIKKLIQEYENTKTLGKYLFPSPTDIEKPVDKNSVNRWFRNLSFKATGKHYKNYALRHRKAKKLYDLADRNIISENTALKLLGHSRSQKETYVNRAKEEDIIILKKQAFNTEISEERKNELEKRIQLQDAAIKRISNLAEKQKGINKEMVHMLLNKGDKGDEMLKKLFPDLVEN